MVTIASDPSGALPVVVCQLSRGVAPVVPIAEAVAYAIKAGAGYALIAGAPLVEAKNLAAHLALDQRAQLVMVEDDVLASRDVWSAILDPRETVRTVQTNCRNGEPSTKFDLDGDVFYSGTIMVSIPFAVLRRLERPVFKAIRYTMTDRRTLVPVGPSDRGAGSDTHLWHSIRSLDPRPRMECVGDVVHLMHPMNRERHELQTPCEITAA